MKLSELKEFVKNKADMHEALDRNGWHMPTLDACKKDYLEGVFNFEFYAPKYLEIKMRSCYRPPKK